MQPYWLLLVGIGVDVLMLAKLAKSTKLEAGSWAQASSLGSSTISVIVCD